MKIPNPERLADAVMEGLRPVLNQYRADLDRHDADVKFLKAEVAGLNQRLAVKKPKVPRP